MKHLLFYILLGLFLSAQGQELAILKGQILNDTLDNSGITIVNLNSEIGTITDQEGRFEIEVSLGDTLHLTAVQYAPRRILINKAILAKTQLQLYMIPKITALDEVQLSTISLTGNLKQDVKQTVLKKHYLASDFGIPGKTAKPRSSEERRFYAVTGGAGALGTLISLLNGDYKRFKKHLEVARFQAKVDRNRVKFNNSLYIETLHIPEALIDDFVFYCFEDKQGAAAVNTNNKIELLQFFKEKARPYLKLKEAEHKQEPFKKFRQ